MTTAANLLHEQFADVLATPQDVERLNQTILDLAMRGKLTQQDPNDEPASKLIARIEAEKKETKDKSLPPISDDEKPFDLPKTWEWTRLGEITNYGSSAKRNGGEIDDSTWVLDLEDIEKITSRLIQRIRFNERRFQSDKNIFEKGDVIYGKLRPYLDKVIVADEDGVCSSELVPIKGYSGIDSYYLRFALKRPDFVQYVNSKTYGVKMPRLGTQDARMALIPLPPLVEQKRIVARVEQMFAQTRRLVELLAHAQIDLTNLNASALAHLLSAETPEEFERQWQFVVEYFDLLLSDPAHVAPLRQTILELAVRGKLTRQDAGDEPANELIKRIQAEKARLVAEGKLGKSDPLPPVSEDEMPFALPKGWEWVRFGELGELHRGKSKHRPRNAPFLYEDGKYPFVQTGDVAQSKGHITLYSAMYGEKGLAQSRMWEKGTLCITIAANIAETGILEFDACFPDSIVGFVPSMLIGSADYFQYFVRVAKSKLESYAPATAQKNINSEILNNLPVPLPPTNEILRIVAKVEQLMAQCNALESKLCAAQTNRERLVQSVMAGIAAG